MKEENQTKTPTAAELLLRAYADGEARGGSTQWSSVDLAFERARTELPGRYEELLKKQGVEPETNEQEDH